MKKARVYIAAGILAMVIIATCLGYNSFIQSVGFLSAGYLFGTAGQPIK
ncbi:hypothetical protein ES703_70982 [subsurface metagenome]